ncbi:MAG: RNA-binding S4 domain-containing protein [Sphingomonas sp.]|uniref:S4 domain-containing protein n=1 Tax=Sphingomonas sp. TaxID=28214 RepID=UPI0025EDFDF4|nr:S4 domain-containing protein [Sphingomonas sp.]MBX9882654.1 RNA-binding S4 domain-containing protein [Sphingomonas sp.]
MAEASLRIDKFLWFARLAKTRDAAQAAAEAGQIRLDGRRVDRAHAPVRVGSVIALVRGGAVRVLRVEALPTRRGPPAEAAALYTDLAGIDAAPGPQ